MYKVELLPIALSDIKSIIYYISHVLNNKTAAERFKNKIISTIEAITIFLFLSSKLSFVGLKNEYRCIRINNYIVIYTINDDKKIITITRICYYKRKVDDLLF